MWNAARTGGMKGLAGGLKGARFALWKNPEDPNRAVERNRNVKLGRNPAQYRRYRARNMGRYLVVISLAPGHSRRCHCSRSCVRSYVSEERAIVRISHPPLMS